MIHQSHGSPSENFKELHWNKELRGPDQAGSGGSGGAGGAGGAGGSGGSQVVLLSEQLLGNVF